MSKPKPKAKAEAEPPPLPRCVNCVPFFIKSEAIPNAGVCRRFPRAEVVTLDKNGELLSTTIKT